MIFSNDNSYKGFFTLTPISSDLLKTFNGVVIVLVVSLHPDKQRFQEDVLLDKKGLRVIGGSIRWKGGLDEHSSCNSVSKINILV